MNLFTTTTSELGSYQEAQAIIESPFVTMQPVHRFFLIAFFWGYLLILTLIALWNQTVGAYIVIPALTLFVLIKIAPLIFYQADYGWFHPLIFLTISMTFRLLRNFGTYAWGLDAHIALPEYTPAQLAEVVAYELMVEAAGWLAYFWGFFIGPKLKIPQLTFSQPNYLPLKALLVVGTAMTIFVIFLQRQGGLINHILAWGQSRHVAVAGQYYWIEATNLCVYACLVWLVLDRRVTQNPLFWGCAMISSIAVFFTQGSRSATLVPIGLGLIVWMLRERKVVAARIIIFGFIALTLLNILGEFRRSTWDEEINWQALTNFELSEAISTTELVQRSTSGSGSTAIMARVPHQVDLLYGDTYLAIFTMPIPRGLWPNKPGQADGRVGRTFFNTIAGIPPGPAGEAYWNFHIPGVLVLFFLFGTFHRWLTDVFLYYAGKPAIILLYTLALYLFDPSGSAIVNGLLALIPTFLLLYLFGAISLKVNPGNV